MCNSTFCGLSIQCLGKDGLGWWGAALGLPRSLLGLDDLMTHTLEVRQCPGRVRNVRTPLTSLKVWPYHRRERKNVLDEFSLPPEFLEPPYQRCHWDRCHQGVKEIYSGSTDVLSGTSKCPARANW